MPSIQLQLDKLKKHLDDKRMEFERPFVESR